MSFPHDEQTCPIDNHAVWFAAALFPGGPASPPDHSDPPVGVRAPLSAAGCRSPALLRHGLCSNDGV